MCDEYIYVNLIPLIKIIDDLKSKGYNPDKLKISIWHGVYMVQITQDGQHLEYMNRHEVKQEWEK